MPYLFEDDIAPALAKGKADRALLHLEKDCKDATKALLKRKHDYLGSGVDDDAIKLASDMGQKTGDASRYVKNWAQLGDNVDTIRRRVLGELDNAYRLKIDIRKEGVIGAMYDLAAQIWTILGKYSGPSDEGS